MGLNLTAVDVSGQRSFAVNNFRREGTVNELIGMLVPRMGLDTADPGGREHSHHMFLDRENRHLHGDEIAGEVLQPDDTVRLQPDIQAGAR
jgi:hypothetical protein